MPNSDSAVEGQADVHVIAMHLPNPEDLMLEIGVIMEEMGRGTLWDERRILEVYGLLSVASELLHRVRDGLRDQMALRGIEVQYAMPLGPFEASGNDSPTLH